MDPTGPSYDEQIGETFTQSFTSMAYNITAVQQVDESGYGPAYLLNGLSDKGYWYQVGLGYDWSGTGTGFAMAYEVFDPLGVSVFPVNGGGGLQLFSGPVNVGDTVLLNLYFGQGSYSGQVVMYAYDYNTQAYAYKTYSSESATYFVGDQQGISNPNGFFTGLMTEEYHNNPYFGGEKFVSYHDSAFALNSAWQWIDEYNVYTNQTVFQSSSNAPVFFVNYHQLHSFTSHGASEYSDAYVFDTGNDPVSANFSAQPVLADAGTEARTSFSLTAHGGTPPYTYLFFLDNNLVSNGTFNGGSYSSSIDFGLLSVGPHSYYVDVVDSNGYPASSQTISFNVNANPVLTISSQQTADKGESIPVTYLVDFGTPPYKITLYINGLPVQQGNPGFAMLNVTGEAQIQAELTDAAGYSVISNTVTVLVNPDPVVTVSAQRSATDVGIPSIYTASIVNGTPPYTVTWFVNGQEVQATGNELVFNPASNGTYSIIANVKDGAGFKVNSTISTITVNNDPVILSYTVIGRSTNFFFINNTALSKIVIMGGTPPYSYAWYLNGAEINQTGQPQYTYKFKGMGMNTLQVNVTDSAGFVLKSKVAKVSYSFDLVHVMVVVLILSALPMVVVLIRRHGGRLFSPQSKEHGL